MGSPHGLTQMFKRPCPEIPPPMLIDSLSPSPYQILPPLPTVIPAFEVFGELNFFTHEPESPATPPSGTQYRNKEIGGNAEGQPPPRREKRHRSSSSPEPIQFCTEGLGLECSSSEGVDVNSNSTMSDTEKGREITRQSKNRYFKSYSDVGMRSREGFPPPISSIGKSGRPWVYLKPYRKDGMLVLREHMKELLHATREGGRLRMHLMHPAGGTMSADEYGENRDEGRGVQNLEVEHDNGEYMEEEQAADKNETGHLWFAAIRTFDGIILIKPKDIYS